MAQFRLHGKRAVITQHFNTLPDMIVMDFEWDWKHTHSAWSTEQWQKKILNCRGD